MADRNGTALMMDTAVVSGWISSPDTGVKAIVATLCALVAVPFLLSTYWFADSLQRKRLKYPPGPRPWPIIGNFLLMATPLPHRTLTALAAKFGGLYYLRLGSKNCIVVSTVAVAKELYKTKDAIFASRPGLFAWTVWHNNDPHMRNLAGAVYGPYWRQLKKFMVTEVYSSARFDSHRGKRADEVDHMVRVLSKEVAAQKGDMVAKGENGAVVDMRQWMYAISFNHITRIIAGKRYYGTNELETEKEKKDLHQVTNTLVDVFGTMVISDFIPYLSFVTRLQGYPEYFNKICQTSSTMLAKAFDLEGHKKRSKERGDDPNYVPDFVDVMLEAPFENGKPLPERDICKLLEEMMNAGMETMSTTGEWAMAELAMRPDLIKRAQDELDTVIGTPRIVTEADLPDLPFITALVKEAFRLHPPGVFLIPKESLEDTELLGYHIPKGTMVMVNLTAIHRDSSVYENPEKFDPDRFVARPEVNHMSGTDFFELMPFGAGRRMCPGNRMGDTMVRLMVANLLYLFDWSLPAGQTQVDMREHFGLAVILETSLKMVATPRIHLPVPENTIAH